MSDLKQQIDMLKQEVLTSTEMWDNGNAKEKNMFVLKLVKSNFPDLSLGDAKRLVIGLQEKMQIGSFMPVKIHESLDIIKEYGDIYEIPQKICDFIENVYDGENVIAEFINTFGYFVFVYGNGNTEPLITLIDRYEMEHIQYGGEEDEYMNIGLYNAFIDLLNYFQTDVFDLDEIEYINNSSIKDKPVYIKIGIDKINLTDVLKHAKKKRIMDFVTDDKDIIDFIADSLLLDKKALNYLFEYYQEEFGQTDDVKFDREIFESYFPDSQWFNEKDFTKIEDLFNKIKCINE